MRQPRPTCEQRVGTEGAERSGKKRVKRRPTRQRAWSRDRRGRSSGEEELAGLPPLGSFFQTSKVARDFAKVEFYIYF
jgi:hypothetical protein